MFQIIEMAATLALSLGCSALGLFALAKFAIDLSQSVRGQPLDLSSDEDDGPRRAGRTGRVKVSVRLLTLAVSAALLLWLSYALALRAMAPVR
jgi:hypothetical protein